MRNSRIRITYEIVTEESAREGDVAERGWRDEEGIPMSPDKDDVDEGITAVDKALTFLKSFYVSEYSCSSFWQGAWYSTESTQNYRDGSWTTESFHLVDFTEEEEREIFDRFKRK